MRSVRSAFRPPPFQPLGHAPQGSKQRASAGALNSRTTNTTETHVFDAPADSLSHTNQPHRTTVEGARVDVGRHLHDHGLRLMPGLTQSSCSPTQPGSRPLARRSRMTTTPATAGYWEPLWAGGRRYRKVTSTEVTLLADHIGPGRGLPALDIGTGDGALARCLHQLGYHATGIDFAPSAIVAARNTQVPPHDGGPDWRLMDFAVDGLNALPDPAYAVVTCRLV